MLHSLPPPRWESPQATHYPSVPPCYPLLSLQLPHHGCGPPSKRGSSVSHPSSPASRELRECLHCPMSDCSGRLQPRGRTPTVLTAGKAMDAIGVASAVMRGWRAPSWPCPGVDLSLSSDPSGKWELTSATSVIHRFCPAIAQARASRAIQPQHWLLFLSPRPRHLPKCGPPPCQDPQRQWMKR